MDVLVAAMAPLSDCALGWMFEKLTEVNSGLQFDKNRIEKPFRPNSLHEIRNGDFRIITLLSNLFGKQPRTIPMHTDVGPGSMETEVISTSTWERIQGVKGWLPPNLKEFYDRKQLGDRWNDLLAQLQDVAIGFRARGNSAKDIQ